MRKRITTLLAVVIFIASISTLQATAAPKMSPQCVGNLTCLQFRVGPPVRITGPGSGIPDSPFYSRTVAGGIRAYAANAITKSFSGTTVANLTLNPGDVIGPPTPPMIPKRFDEDGAWLISTAGSAPGITRGWYHAEKIVSGVHLKSIAYAESTDDGATFNRPTNYPNNQIITGKPGSVVGDGDGSMVFFNNYYYMYFMHDNGPRGVARSYFADNGLPGTWTKYHNGAFGVQPGIGGDFTALNDIGGSGSASNLGIVSDTTVNGVAFIGTDSSSVSGLKLSFSTDAVNFTGMPEPLLYSDGNAWTRPSPIEFVAYPSIVSTGGNHYWSSNGSFYLFYTYIPPGKGPTDRYLVRRQVDVVTNNTPITPQVRVALGRYYSATATDHWETTALVEPSDGYSYEFNLGYLFTKQIPGTHELLDCYYPGNHIALPSASCIGGGTKLRTLGWIYTNPQYDANNQPTTVPLWRCYWISQQDHFLSPNNCGPSNPDVSQDWIVGHISIS